MKKNSKKSCFADSGKEKDYCKVESVITVDDRGQMVLPKEIRDSAGIHAGDKLAVMCWKSDGKVCYISLIRVDELTDLVRDKIDLLLKGTNKQI